MNRLSEERVRDDVTGPVSDTEATRLALEVLDLRATLEQVARALPVEQCQCHTAGCGLDHQVRVARRTALQGLTGPEHLPGVVYQDAS